MQNVKQYSSHPNVAAELARRNLLEQEGRLFTDLRNSRISLDTYKSEMARIKIWKGEAA